MFAERAFCRVSSRQLSSCVVPCCSDIVIEPVDPAVMRDLQNHRSLEADGASAEGDDVRAPST